MQISIELPSDFVSFQNENHIKREILLSYALWLFKTERVTLSKAATLSDMDIYDFMAACKDNKIPIIDISREEILDELDGFFAG